MANDPMQTGDAEAKQPPDAKLPDAKKEEAAAKKPLSVQAQLASIVALLESTVKSKDTRMLAGRLHRLTAAIRSHLTPEILSQFFTTHLSGPEASASRDFLSAQVTAPAEPMRSSATDFACRAMQVPDAGSAMQVEGESSAAAAAAPAAAATSTLPEVELYAFLLMLTYCIDHSKNEQVGVRDDSCRLRLEVSLSPFLSPYITLADIRIFPARAPRPSP